jgi:hypothetical protein
MDASVYQVTGRSVMLLRPDEVQEDVPSPIPKRRRLISVRAERGRYEGRASYQTPRGSSPRRAYGVDTVPDLLTFLHVLTASEGPC